MEICQICQKKLKNTTALASHIAGATHRMSVKDYYDKYLKKPEEDICPRCRQPKKFSTLRTGYPRKYCSERCYVNPIIKFAQEKKQARIDKIDPKLWKTCAICGMKCVGFSGLGTHLSHGHKVLTKDYYDKYLKIDPEEGFCTQCKKPTRFSGLGVGYVTYCERKCMRNSPEIRKILDEKAKGRKQPLQEKANRAETMSKRMQAQYELTGKPTTSPFGFTTCGVAELEFIKELQAVCKHKIIPQYAVAGHLVDGYIKELNLIIEFDELHHSGLQVKKDRQREQNILKELPETKFFRVSESDWVKDPENILRQFMRLIYTEEEVKQIEKGTV